MSLLTNPWMQIGMGLLANSGPSLSPVNPWRGIGQGLMAANEAKVAEAEQQYMELARKQEQEKWRRTEEQRGYLDSMVATETNPQLAAMARVAPDEYVKRKLSTPTESADLSTAGELGLKGYPADTPVQVKRQGGAIVDYKVLSPDQVRIPASIQEYNLSKEDPGFLEYLRTTGSQPAPAVQFLPTADGYMVGNIRSGEVTPAMGPSGRPVIPAMADPNLQRDIAGGRKAGEIVDGAQAQAQVDLPQKVATADQTISLVKELRDHPGLPGVVGIPDILSAGGRVPGTPEADFRARLDQLQGQQFLQAYETLKGSGQITEIEGTKAQNAIARMQTSQSEREFKKAADDFVEIIQGAVGRAKKKAGQKDDYTYVPGKGLVKQ